MYMVMSRSGSMASSVSSWAMTSLALASSIWTPRKMIRSSKSLLYGFISLIPYEVRSTKDGSTYLDCTSRGMRGVAPPEDSSITVAPGSWGLVGLPGRALRAHAHGGFVGAADHVVDE